MDLPTHPGLLLTFLHVQYIFVFHFIRIVFARVQFLWGSFSLLVKV